jgi:O-antigen/teichoic acid export membrane protein
MVILTYGMETGFFRYADKEHDKNNVYRSALIPLLFSSLAFIILATLFSHQISGFIGYQNNPEYIILVALIVGLDAFTAIPFARLRLENKALKYALIRIFEVVINISANWFFLFYCPKNFNENNFINAVYYPDIGIGYVFISNLLSSVFKVIMLTKEILIINGRFNFELFRKILIYSFPLLIAGLAGTINEALDRILLKHLLLEADNPMEQLGIYGANYKLAVLMTLFVQMFRYASEPFFFSKKDEKDARQIYAVIMKYFIFAGMAILEKISEKELLLYRLSFLLI